MNNIEAQHPSVYYTLAAKLFHDGKKDDAVFWFYLGQLRYRFHLAANPKLEPSGDPAHFASLGEVVGRPLNEYAFSDIPKLAATIDKVLQWDAAHDNGFTSQKTHAAEWQQIRSGLEGLKANILQNQEQIKSLRKANGLE